MNVSAGYSTAATRIAGSTGSWQMCASRNSRKTPSDSTGVTITIRIGVPEHGLTAAVCRRKGG
jgi:hypothetical protein